MLWRNAGDTPEEDPPTERELAGPVFVQPDSPRPATILKVATQLEERGAEIQELFKEIRSPLGDVAWPIHLIREGKDVFVEVETTSWTPSTIEEIVGKAAVLRDSEYASADLEMLSAYTIPREIEFFFGDSAAALFQLALIRADPDRPEEAASLFRAAAGSKWGLQLDYQSEYLPLVEELLTAALQEGESPPILDALVVGLGCFVGETIRRNANPPGAWRLDEEWGEGPILEVGGLLLDPVGKARAFLLEGAEDSVAFYATYVLDQLAQDAEES